MKGKEPEIRGQRASEEEISNEWDLSTKEWEDILIFFIWEVCGFDLVFYEEIFK